jgi:hypothetical protein
MSLPPGKNEFLYTGAPVSLSIPSNGTIMAYVYGAAGESNDFEYYIDEDGNQVAGAGWDGGGGGYITGKISVMAGNTIEVNVGGGGGRRFGLGTPGYNGGGTGGISGGGLSSVRLNNSWDESIIAGGGG